MIFTDSSLVVLHPQQTSLTTRIATIDHSSFTNRVKSATFRSSMEEPLRHKELMAQRPKTAGDIQQDYLWKQSTNPTQNCHIDDIEEKKTQQQMV